MKHLYLVIGIISSLLRGRLMPRWGNPPSPSTKRTPQRGRRHYDGIELFSFVVFGWFAEA